MKRFNVRKVAVLGAGVMGAQIAAHLVNVKVPVVLFDLPAKEGPKNGIVTKAIDGLKKLKPAPLGVPEDAALIEQANYEEHLAQLGECDLIIEAIAERMDWKLDLYTKIAPRDRAARDRRLQHLGPVDHQAVRGAAGGDPAALLRHPLLQPAALHVAGGADRHADHRARGARPARDLRHHRARQVRGARQGHAQLHRQPRRHRRHAGDDEGGREVRPDATTWSTTSPARSSAAPAAAPSAPPTWWAWTRWRTSSRRCRTTCKDDPFYASYATPAVLQKLLDAGALGQKTGAGFYKKVGKDILRFDAEKGDYVPGGDKADEIVARILKKPPAERLKLLRDSKNPQAQFLWAILRDSFHYAAVHLADDRRERARRRLRDALGLRHERRARSSSGRRPAGRRWRSGSRKTSTPARRCRKAPLPAWVFDGLGGGDAGVHAPRARAAPPMPASTRRARCRSTSASRSARACSARARRRRSRPAPGCSRTTSVRVWTLDGEVLIASITAKMHLISPGVIEGLLKARRARRAGVPGPRDLVARRRVLGRRQPRGADAGVHEERQQGHRPEVKKLQDAMLRVRYAQVPVVAAMRGIALGGGCEMALYSRASASRRWRATSAWSKSASA